MTSVSKWGNASVLAQNAIERHVKAHQQSLAQRSIEGRVSERLARSIITGCIPDIIGESFVSDWHRMPYVLLCRALLRCRPYKSWDEWSRVFADPKIDEWIILNEKWLRANEKWEEGLVTLSDASVVFLRSSLNGDKSARLVFRSGYLPGYTLLNRDREQHVCIQPSTNAFKAHFEDMTGGLLRNLDWNNVLVAGGIILGALVVTQFDSRYIHRHPSGHWTSSDIDIYLYGLSSSDANKKLTHIFDVFRSNLPPGMRTLTIRNSKTVTFYADYPLRRIQIVLKLVGNPRDVLLNFDLDICAMGWDGSNVFMLPRAARALETGFNTFTMNLVRGHYLSERRASQPHRIFKYADRGYGIRILPSYISSLNRQRVGQVDGNFPPLNLQRLEDEALTWVEGKLGAEGYVHSDLSALKIHGLTVLTGFTSLMRHVFFRERAGLRSEDVLPDEHDWASHSYEDTYEPIPTLQYQWNEAFNHARFRTCIIQSNRNDIDQWIRMDLAGRLQQYDIQSGDELNRTQRMTFASTAKELLQSAKHIRMPLLLPVDFATYANELVQRSLASAGLAEETILEPVGNWFEFNSATTHSKKREGLFLWTIGSQLMWQHIDRRIDELFEVLHAFRRANRTLEEDLQLQRFAKGLSKRDISLRALDELEAFAQWMGQHPEQIREN